MTTELTSEKVKEICQKIVNIGTFSDSDRYWTNINYDSHNTFFEEMCSRGELVWKAPNIRMARFLGGILRYTINKHDDVLLSYFDIEPEVDGETYDDEEMQKLGEYSCKFYEDKYIEIYAELDDKQLMQFVFNHFNADDESVHEIPNILNNTQIAKILNGDEKLKVTNTCVRCSNVRTHDCEVINNKDYSEKLDEKRKVDQERWKAEQEARQKTYQERPETEQLYLNSLTRPIEIYHPLPGVPQEKPETEESLKSLARAIELHHQLEKFPQEDQQK